jgi:hypothetical protein
MVAAVGGSFAGRTERQAGGRKTKRPAPAGPFVHQTGLVPDLPAYALAAGARFIDAAAIHPRPRSANRRSHRRSVVVMVMMFGEGYRTPRQRKDRRKGNRTNFHRFLPISAGNGICFIGRQRPSPVRVPSPTTAQARAAPASQTIRLSRARPQRTDEPMRRTNEKARRRYREAQRRAKVGWNA